MKNMTLPQMAPGLSTCLCPYTGGGFESELGVQSKAQGSAGRIGDPAPLIVVAGRPTVVAQAPKVSLGTTGGPHPRSPDTVPVPT